MSKAAVEVMMMVMATALCQKASCSSGRSGGKGAVDGSIGGGGGSGSG